MSHVSGFRGVALIVADPTTGTIPPEITAWFEGRDWRIRSHQHGMFAAAQAGQHAMLVADTGAGKTLAGFIPTLADFCPSRVRRH